jgi:hypothetical protein
LVWESQKVAAYRAGFFRLNGMGRKIDVSRISLFPLPEIAR